MGGGRGGRGGGGPCGWTDGGDDMIYGRIC